MAEAARALVVVPRAFAGVPVREVAALDDAVPSCFVGDLVGDYGFILYQNGNKVPHRTWLGTGSSP